MLACCATMTAVTVLLASHDRLPLLRESIASALEQSHPDIEVLVVDDGSGAETRRWLAEQQAQHPRLRVVCQDRAGVGAARARGVREASRELVTILDSDDRLTPDAVARLTAEFERDPETDLVYTNHYHVLPEGRTERTDYPPYPDNGRMLRAILLRPRVPFKHSGTTFRRQKALELGNYDAELGIKIDIDFVLRFVTADCRLRILPGDPVVYFHTHGQSMSRKRLRGIRAWWTIIDRYSADGIVRRTSQKALRAAWELAKWGYAGVRWRGP